MTSPGDHRVWSGLERRLSAVEGLVPEAPPWRSREEHGASVQAPVRLGSATRRNAGSRTGARRGPVARLGWALAIIGLLLAILVGALLAGAFRWQPQPDLSTGPFGPTGLLRGSDSSSDVALLPDGRALIVTARTDSFGMVGAPHVRDPEGRLRQTGPPVAPRLNPTATLLLDGRVLVVGGMGGPLAYPDTAVATAELWDPVTERFTATGSMAHARVGHTATLLADGRVLVAGGAWPRTADATAEVWDPATGRFTAAGQMGLGVNNRGVGRSNHSAVLLPDGRVLVAGGIGADGTGRGRSETWEPPTGEFRGHGTFLDNPSEFSLTRLLDGRVLVIVRLPALGAISETWDLTRQIPHANGPPLETARFSQRGVLLGDGRVAVFGSRGATDDETVVEIFDPETATFGRARPLSGPIAGRSFTLLPDGRILVVGQVPPGEPQPDVTVYSLEGAP